MISLKRYSMKASEYCTVITTTDNKENAELITQTLLDNELAACVQSSQIESTYRWKGKTVTGEEIRLDIKTKTSLYPKVKETILSLHTYEVPELHMHTWEDAYDPYLRWIRNETVQPTYTESVTESLLHEL